MEVNAFDSMSTNFGGVSSTKSGSWVKMRSIKRSSGVNDSTGNESNQGKETIAGQVVNIAAPSRFATQTELVYVRPARPPSLHPDIATNSLRSPPGIKNNNQLKYESISIQLGRTENNGGQSGAVTHTHAVRTGLDADDNFSNR